MNTKKDCCDGCAGLSGCIYKSCSGCHTGSTNKCECKTNWMHEPGPMCVPVSQDKESSEGTCGYGHKHPFAENPLPEPRPSFTEKTLEEFRYKFGDSAPRIAMRSFKDCDDLEQWLTSKLEEAQQEKDFLIVAARQEGRLKERERLISLIEKKRWPKGTSFTSRALGYNQALDQILGEINKKP